jgi:sugar lactone lactonase YvrE
LYGPKTNHTSVHAIESNPGCLAPCTENTDEIIVATQEGLAWFNLSKLTSEMVVERMRIEDKPDNRFNDGKVDPAGR